jgi:hypothetical protein
MRAIILLLAASALWLFGSCSSSGGQPDGNDVPDAQDGTDEGGDTVTTRVISFSDRQVVDDRQAGQQLSLSPTPDGRFAVGYFARGSSKVMCNSHPGGMQIEIQVDHVRYATYDGSAWHTEDVADYSSELNSGISLLFDGNTPVLAYLGGADASQCCGGSDLITARRGGGGGWTPTISVAMSSEATAGADCPVMQGLCDTGDLVGLWPSMAKAPDGKLGVVWRDLHLCYAQTDQDMSDLEYAEGANFGTKRWVDLGRGSGDFNSLAFGPDGAPAVATYNGKNGAIYFSRWTNGAWDPPPPPQGENQCAVNALCTQNLQDSCPDGQVCIANRCSNLISCVDGILPDGSISLAIDPQGRYLVAYFDLNKKNLAIAHSTDGRHWTRGVIDGDGATGMSPKLMFDPISGMPEVVYYRCSDYNPNSLNCNRNQDGVKFAIFTGKYPDELGVQAKWKKTNVSRDNVAFDGRHLSAGVLPDGTVGVAYSYNWTDPGTNEPKEQVMFQLGTWQ